MGISVEVLALNPERRTPQCLKPSTDDLHMKPIQRLYNLPLGHKQLRRVVETVEPAKGLGNCGVVSREFMVQGWLNGTMRLLIEACGGLPSRP